MARKSPAPPVGSFVGPNVAGRGRIGPISTTAPCVRFRRFAGHKPQGRLEARCFTHERSQVRNPPRPCSIQAWRACLEVLIGPFVGANGGSLAAPLGLVGDTHDLPDHRLVDLAALHAPRGTHPGSSGSAPRWSRFESGGSPQLRRRGTGPFHQLAPATATPWHLPAERVAPTHSRCLTTSRNRHGRPPMTSVPRAQTKDFQPKDPSYRADSMAGLTITMEVLYQLS